MRLNHYPSISTPLSRSYSLSAANRKNTTTPVRFAASSYAPFERDPIRNKFYISLFTLAFTTGGYLAFQNKDLYDTHRKMDRNLQNVQKNESVEKSVHEYAGYLRTIQEEVTKNHSDEKVLESLKVFDALSSEDWKQIEALMQKAKTSMDKREHEALFSEFLDTVLVKKIGEETADALKVSTKLFFERAQGNDKVCHGFDIAVTAALLWYITMAILLTKNSELRPGVKQMLEKKFKIPSRLLE